MGMVQLTQRQINLLYILVDHQRNGRLIEPFGTVPISASEYVIYIRRQSSMRVRHVHDFDALCENGYLEYEWNRLSNAKLYTVSKLAHLTFKSGELTVRKEKTMQIAPVTLKNGHLSSEDQKYMALLDEANRVRMLLKREIAAVLYGTDLGDAVAELTAVQDLYYMVRPDTDVITQIVHKIGQRLVAQLAIVDDMDGRTAVAQSLVTFGLWTQLVFRLCSR